MFAWLDALVRRPVIITVAVVVAVAIVSWSLAPVLFGIPVGDSNALEAWYLAANIVLALVGSAAVLQISQAERHERERNRRESVQLTLQQVDVFETRLRPALEELQSLVRKENELHPSWFDISSPRVDAPFTTSGIVTELPLDEIVAKKPAGGESYAADYPHKMSPFHPVTKEKTGYPSPACLLRDIDMMAAHLLHANCDIDMARSMIGANYVHLLYGNRAYLASSAKGANAWANVISLYRLWAADMSGTA